MCPYYLDGDRLMAGAPCAKPRAGPAARRSFTPAANGDLPFDVDQLCSFQGPARAQPGGFPGWSLKTQQYAACMPEHTDRPGPVDVLEAPALRRATGRLWPGAKPRVGPRRGDGLKLPRKEVIQPHLPVRLPCYDFTPITSPTFDGSLPEGWVTGFGCCPLSWCDGRCVQDPGTYSPRRC
jgi:hypothetical protein